MIHQVSMLDTHCRRIGYDHLMNEAMHKYVVGIKLAYNEKIEKLVEPLA